VLRYSTRLGAMAIVLGTFAVFLVATGYAQDRLFAAKGVVVDQAGAVITHAQLAFKGESGIIVSPTGMDGFVNVNLKAGKYVVTVSASGFATTQLVDFWVPGSTADAFRVVLNVDPDASLRSDRYHDDIEVPTLPSELRNILPDDPTPTSLPVVRPATIKHRSTRCLYLWRCSASKP
jgi:hypothetical protein